MFNVGMSELLIFAIIAILVLGPDKLPTAIRTVIQYYKKIKMLMHNVQHDIERELEISEIREQMKVELARIHDIEKQMQIQLDQIQKEVEHIDSQSKEPNMPASHQQIQTKNEADFISPPEKVLSAKKAITT